MRCCHFWGHLERLEAVIDRVVWKWQRVYEGKRWYTLYSCMKGKDGTHCKIMQHTATHGNTMVWEITCGTAHSLQHTATNRNTLQHTTTHYNTMIWKTACGDAHMKSGQNSMCVHVHVYISFMCVHVHSYISFIYVYVHVHVYIYTCKHVHTHI